MKPTPKKKFLKLLQLPPTELVRVYTWQPETVLDILDKDGVFYPDFSKSEYKDYNEFTNAYQWIMKFMDKNIENFSGNYPVWFWNKKPDLRQKILNENPSDNILITALIPRGRLLFSDFYEWYYVLMDCYRNNTNSDKNYYNDEEEDFIATTREQREKSWEDGVFNGRNAKRVAIQCCADGLYKHEIVNVWRQKNRLPSIDNQRNMA